MNKRLLLKNADVFDDKTDGLRRNVAILVDADTIKAVVPSPSAAVEDTAVLDCAGKYILPGLFECHTHLTILTNQTEEVKSDILKECHVGNATPEKPLDEQVLRAFVDNGITQVRDVGGPVETLRGMRQQISQGAYVGPDLFYAGPMLEKSPLTGEGNNKRWPGFTLAVDSRTEATAVVASLSSAEADLIKVFSKFDRNVLRHLLAEAQRHNLPVTFDPGPTFFHAIPMDTALRLGICCFEHGKSPWYVTLDTHLKNEHDSLLDAEPEKKQAFVDRLMSIGVESISMPKLQELAGAMVTKDAFICPTLHVFKDYAERTEVYVEDETKHDAMRRKMKALSEVARFITGAMAKNGVKVLVGQDGWNPTFTAKEMQLLTETGLSTAEVIKGATVYPATWLGVANRYGSVAPGRKANLLILNSDPLVDIRNVRDIHAVIKDGRIAFR